MKSALEQKSLSRIEKFGLFTSVIGLLADTLSLMSFIAGAWGLNEENLSNNEHTLFVVITGMVIGYGWVVLTWIITKQASNRLPTPIERTTLERQAAGAAIGVGLLLLPLIVIWLSIVFKETDGVVVSLLFLYPLAAFGIWGSIVLLMPLIYKDFMIDASEYRAQINTALEEHWPKWEKRISFELEKRNWVTVYDLQDLAELLQVPPEYIEIAFAKYAATYPEKANFGYLYLSDDSNTPVSHYRVLVNSKYEEGWLE